MICEFKHKVGEQVEIPDMCMKAVIIGLFYTETGIQYQVTYIYEGEQKYVYLYEFQLKSINGNSNKVGFQYKE